jgi:hypothetical protein
VTLTPFEQVVLIGTGVSSCLNTALQILRSRARKAESEERRKELAERRAFQTWLYEHGTREEQAHEELVEAVRSVTPISVPKARE